MSRRRRYLVLGAALVAVAVAGGAAWWFLWVPTWRPPLRDGERYGIDVSAHQGSVDWARVARDDIAFAYIKATEGRDFTDRRFEGNWRGAGEVGLARGAYHFFTLCTPGADQARHFLEVARPDPGALAPAVDLELVGNCRARPPTAAVAAEVGAFVALVEEAWGRRVVLYVGDEFERKYPVREGLGRDRPLWHRRFLRRPDVRGWAIWQLHGYARVDGVDGGVDLNVMRRSP